MQILQTSFIPSHCQFPHTLSSANSSTTITTTTTQFSLLPKLSSLSLTHHTPPPSLFIRCGGGPRTYPGGVSKWQWKRMQSKKSKQLLKARLARERSIYEMRKRAELKAAVSNLERPWEIVQTNDSASSSSSQSKSQSLSSLFSVSADEQLKVLADRFQKPGGFDLWSDNDGPQVFNNTRENLPSSRFFPKGVVHSLKPYDNIDVGAKPNLRRKEGYQTRLSGEDSQFKDGANRTRFSVQGSESKGKDGRRFENLQLKDGNWKDKEVRGGGGDSRRIHGRRGQNSNGGEGNGRKLGRSYKNKRYSNRGQNVRQLREVNGEDVFDMSLQGDGTYGFSATNNDHKSN